MTIAAFFDVDGTVTRTSIIHPLIWYQRDCLSLLRNLLHATGLVLQAPRYVFVDRRSRSQFQCLFYRRYGGLKAAELRAWHRETFAHNLQRAIFPDALECIRKHQEQGHRIVLVTGALDFVMQPLAEHLHADDLFAVELEDREGLFTGELKNAPVADEAKAAIIHTLAEQHGLDLAQSFAYGNNWGDVHMLECVGHPIAVNPDSRLRRLAKDRGWRIVRWRIK